MTTEHLPLLVADQAAFDEHDAGMQLATPSQLPEVRHVRGDEHPVLRIGPLEDFRVGHAEHLADASTWCDKWCERCPVAESCPVGRAELRRPRASPAENMAQAMASIARVEAMLALELQREGIEVREEEVAAHVAERRALFSHPLALQASSWSRAARTWLAGGSGEAAAVVGWYGSLVPAKVHRALGACEPDALGTAKVVTLGLHA